MTGPARLAVDLGTSHTVAVVHLERQAPRALLFDGSPLLPSAVFASSDGTLVTGRDAQRLARTDPERFEPHPKQRAGDGVVLLGAAEYPVSALLGAVLRRVLQAAAESGVAPSDEAVLTCPSDWGRTRRGVLHDAAAWAGMTAYTLVDEPVAAAAYCLRVLRLDVPAGQSLAVFDFGGGTLDVAVVRREPAELRVVATGGLQDLGGLDVDAALVEHLGRLVEPGHPQLWQRVTRPSGPADLRDRQALWAEVRAAKEMLSRAAVAPVELPGAAAAALHLTREEFDEVVAPLVDRAVAEAHRVVSSAGGVVRVLLVGGSSRIPLVATRLHARLGLAPTVPEQPELPVAYGAVAATQLLARPAPVKTPELTTVGLSTVGPARTAADVPVATVAAAGKRRWPLLVVALAVVALLAGAGAWYAADRHTQHSSSGSPGASTSAAVHPPGGAGSAAPAGYVACQAADIALFCPTQPICWGGIAVIGGAPPTASRIDCSEPHRWESFAGGYRPAAANDLPYNKLLTDPVIGRACSDAVLAARSVAPRDTQGWVVDVLPQVPASGPAVFHCLARPPAGSDWLGSAFNVG